MCIYICIPRGRVGDFCAYIYASLAERVKKAMEEGYRIVSVLELGNLLRSEWKLEHEVN